MRKLRIYIVWTVKKEQVTFLSENNCPDLFNQWSCLTDQVWATSGFHFWFVSEFNEQMTLNIEPGAERSAFFDLSTQHFKDSAAKHSTTLKLLCQYIDVFVYLQGCKILESMTLWNLLINLFRRIESVK